jgi:hypothetical protein
MAADADRLLLWQLVAGYAVPYHVLLCLFVIFWSYSPCTATIPPLLFHISGIEGRAASYLG